MMMTTCADGGVDHTSALVRVVVIVIRLAWPVTVFLDLLLVIYQSK